MHIKLRFVWNTSSSSILIANADYFLWRQKIDSDFMIFFQCNAHNASCTLTSRTFRKDNVMHHNTFYGAMWRTI